MHDAFGLPTRPHTVRPPFPSCILPPPSRHVNLHLWSHAGHWLVISEQGRNLSVASSVFFHSTMLTESGPKWTIHLFPIYPSPSHRLRRRQTRVALTVVPGHRQVANGDQREVPYIPTGYHRSPRHCSAPGREWSFPAAHTPVHCANENPGWYGSGLRANVLLRELAPSASHPSAQPG
ncbi:hypothetical protein L227DRAFT_368691 [Lentinus tigrinus ALCF2SS1-6]|uniref:Uncharacterized protein n=1 Tax=Lentinus tigrinus ALCF2SS1-6 TaxID=1328759 RepID=A0A5C2RSA3_9APHY|nr:hypothetical protein L227DRAFT_368691 [Lentinus tigrinus ALCF2SS1-6]